MPMLAATVLLLKTTAGHAAFAVTRIVRVNGAAEPLSTNAQLRIWTCADVEPTSAA
jgi:hypothetical protein